MSTTFRQLWLSAPLLIAAMAAPGCAAEADDGTDEATGAIAEPGEGDLPWEVRSRFGETFVPNVFYAEASQNEQIMPLTIAGRHQIDRLIYPTLGNPNLFVKSDPRDELVTVLRVEKELLAHLRPDIGTAVGRSSFLRRFEVSEPLRNDPNNGLRVYLVSRASRASATTSNAAVRPGPGVFEIKPSAIYAHAISEDMPVPFQARYTLRMVFDNAKMSAVGAGLYDLRVEIVKDGAILPAPGVNTQAYEYQYNAVKVFDKVAPDYSVINVTDTQVSHTEPSRGPLGSTAFEKRTLAHLKEFVQRVNNSSEPDVKNAAFVMFNGDLHNGGSPEVLRPSRVAWTYNDEANVILDSLKELSVPIFLSMGNHDGYASTGQVPAVLDNMLGRVVDWVSSSEQGTLRETVLAAQPKEWPRFDWNDYKRFLDTTKTQLGGRHLDLVSGAYRRLQGVEPGCDFCFLKGWVEVDRSKRNYMLYDGIHQWHRTYGPTYASWTLNKTRYVNLNTFELRQHRRTGWGMYTVNYGGGMSQVQVEWTKKELERADASKEDVVIVGHHDRRGGHKGKDFPYYFKPLEYRGMDESAKNYVMGEIVSPKICELVPEWAQTHDVALGCLHDGLQEWLRADTEFDCEDANRFRDARGSVDGKCDEASFSGSTHPWYSGYELLDLLMLHPSARTLVLGHTHYASVEVMHAGQKIVPTSVTLDAATQKRLGAAESTNPFRSFSLFKSNRPDATYDPNFVTPGLSVSGGNAVVDLAKAGHAFANHVIMGEDRELLVLRLNANADLTGQSYVGMHKRNSKGDAVYGFSTLRVSRKDDARGYSLPQINEVAFYLNEQNGSFEAVERKPLDRTATIASAQVNAANPFCQMFRGTGAEACR